MFLVPDTEYFISVRAENKAGQGEEYHTDVRTKDTDGKLKDFNF